MKILRLLVSFLILVVCTTLVSCVPSNPPNPFELTPQVSPLLPFLEQVSPKPGAIITKSQYKGMRGKFSDTPLWAELKWNLYSPSFRYQHDQDLLEFISANAQLTLDGQIIKSQRLESGISGNTYTDANGIERMYDGGPFVFSWEADLDVGLHKAKFEILNEANSQLEFSWEFVITP